MSTLTLASLLEQRLYSRGRRAAVFAERLRPFLTSLNFRVEGKDRTEARDRFSQMVNSTVSDTQMPHSTLVHKHEREDEAVLAISLDDLADALEALSLDLDAQMGQSRPLRGLLDGLVPVEQEIRPQFGTVNLNTEHPHHALRWDEQDANEGGHDTEIRLKSL